MKKLNVLEWNIRAAASIGWDNDFEIHNWLVDKVVNNDYDVIILNEFAISKGWDYCQNQLKQKGYIWFMTYTSCENGILIALKNDTFNIKCRDDVHICKRQVLFHIFWQLIFHKKRQLIFHTYLVFDTHGVIRGLFVN